MSTDIGTWQSCSYCGRPLVSGVAVGGGLFHPECVSGPGYPPRPGYALPPMADHIAVLIAERDALLSAQEKYWRQAMQYRAERDALRAELLREHEDHRQSVEDAASVLRELRAAESERDALHTAICQAVTLMNVGDNRPAHTILREALVAYADAAMKEKP